MYAAAALAEIANEALRWAVTQGASGLTESGLQRRVIDAIHGKGLEFDHPPIVGFGPNAANPHYEPVEGKDLALARDQVVLLDLWAGRRLGTVFADQTWMGFSGSKVPAIGRGGLAHGTRRARRGDRGGAPQGRSILVISLTTFARSGMGWRTVRK